MTTDSTSASASSNSSDGGRSQMRRSRKKRKPQEDNSVWNAQLVFFATALLLGTFLLINPLGWWVDPITGDDIWAGVFGSGMLLVAAAWLALTVRNGVNNRSTLWATACPRCGHNDLKRNQRKTRDRILGYLGIPIRRYICTECRWKGARIDQTRLG